MALASGLPNTVPPEAEPGRSPVCARDWLLDVALQDLTGRKGPLLSMVYWFIPLWSAGSGDA